jgi:hypothetical protein
MRPFGSRHTNPVVVPIHKRPRAIASDMIILPGSVLFPMRCVLRVTGSSRSKPSPMVPSHMAPEALSPRMARTLARPTASTSP